MSNSIYAIRVHYPTGVSAYYSAEEVGGEPFLRLRDKFYATEKAAASAVEAAYREVYSRIPKEAGCTLGPRYAREYFSRVVVFPIVLVEEMSVNA